MKKELQLISELSFFRLLPLWVGARGVEFDWKYIQMCFESNINLVCIIISDSIRY